ncbi:hypothetical protein ACQP3C_31040, partial [Escherichia coli]
VPSRAHLHTEGEGTREFGRHLEDAQACMDTVSLPLFHFKLQLALQAFLCPTPWFHLSTIHSLPGSFFKGGCHL